MIQCSCLARWWNWKSAVLSSLVRSAIFFIATLGAGIDAARAAFVTELLFRSVTSGFYGALTQSFRTVRPTWMGTLAAVLLLPLCSHGLEFSVHRFRGTERLAVGMTLSVAFTAVSTAFNLFAMRKGALIVGADSAPLWTDLQRLPVLLVAFVTAMCGSVSRLVRS